MSRLRLVNFHRNILLRCLLHQLPLLLHLLRPRCNLLHNKHERHVLILLSVVHLDVLIIIVSLPIKIMSRLLHVLYLQTVQILFQMAASENLPYIMSMDVLLRVDSYNVDNKIKKNIFYEVFRSVIPRFERIVYVVAWFSLGRCN